VAHSKSGSRSRMAVGPSCWNDVIHDIATLWDVTNGEENGIKVAEFSDFTLSRSSAVASIFKTIDDYLERRAS